MYYAWQEKLPWFSTNYEVAHFELIWAALFFIRHGLVIAILLFDNFLTRHIETILGGFEQRLSSKHENK